MSNALSVQIGRVIDTYLYEKFDEQIDFDFFPDLQQQLDKLTVIHYDNIKETNAPSDEELRGSRHINKRRKVSSLR